MGENTGAVGATREMWTVSRAESLRELWPGAWFESLTTNEDFHATVSRRHFSSMRLEGIDATPYRCQRTSLDVAAYPTDSLSINVVMQGELHMREGRQEYTARPGDVFVHRNDAFSFECPSPTQTFRAVVAPRLMPPIVGRDRPLGLCPSSVLTRAYIRFAHEVLASATESDPPPVDTTLEQSALTLQCGLVRSVLDREYTNTRSKEELRLQVAEYIEHRITDPDLDIEEISRELRISRRWLFRVFEDEPESITDGIRRRRVERATLDLELHPELSVHEIGRRNGFGGRDRLTKAFRDHHGHAPTDHRRERDAGR